MIKLILALVIIATAANARASDEFAFVQCGVKLGGKYLTYKPSAERSEEKRKRDTRLNYVAGIAQAEPNGFTLGDTGTESLPAEMTDTSLAVEFRLPPKVTVASFGCSWR
ncbi:MAG: hypothetical protein KDI33_12035 [Halioglobus sp.]|nr:hypothetical protein [Halioglobus sp.]